MHNFRYSHLLIQGLVLYSDRFSILDSILNIFLNVAKYVLMFLVCFLDLPIDISLCMVIIMILVDDKPYNGTFATSSSYDILRIAIHMFLMTLFWPFCHSLGFDVTTYVFIYVVLSFLEHIPRGCAFSLKEDFMEERNTAQMNHDISPIVAYMIAKYVFGFHSFSAVLFILINVFSHTYLIAYICSPLVSFIIYIYLSIKEIVVLHQNFLRRFDKQKISYYLFITLIKVICVLVSSLLLCNIVYKEFLFLHGENDWKQTIDLSDAKTFSDKLDISSTQMCSLESPLKVEKYYQNESFTIKSMYTEAVVNRSQKCKIKKAILRENVLLSIKQKKMFRNGNSTYFWTFNESPIRDTRKKKYISFTSETDAKNKYMLIITRLNTQDFGTYCLKKETYYSNTNCRFSFTYKNPENIVHNIILVTRTIICIFLKQRSERVQIYGSLGKIVKLINIKVILGKNEMQPSIYNSKSFMEDKYYCPCSLLVDLFIRTGHTKTIRQISDSWSEVTFNISFCICPRAYKFESQLVFYSIWAGYAIPTNFHISVEPQPTDLFKQRYVTEFMQCEKLGFRLNTFYECLRLFHDKTIFQHAISREFYVMCLLESLLFTFTFLVIFVLLTVIRICLDRILFYIFHSNIHKYNGYSFALPSAELEFDIYLSYNDDSSVDKGFAEEIIRPFLKESLGYSIRDCENITPGLNRRLAFEENIIKSRTLILLLSAEYLNNDICMQLEFEYTLLSLLGAAHISKDDVLIIKMDTCPLDARPLKHFTVIDWSDNVTNIRTESEKRTELQKWLSRRFRKPGKLKNLIIHRILHPLYRKMDIIIQKIHEKFR